MSRQRPETAELAPRATDSELYSWFVGSQEDPATVRLLYDYLYCANRPSGDVRAFHDDYLPRAMWYFDYLEQADAQYASLLQSRKLGLLERGWRVEAARTDPPDNGRKGKKRPSKADSAKADKAEELAEFARRNLERLPNFEQDLFELLDAISKGFAVSEIMWRLDGGKWVVDCLKSRPQRRFSFDDKGQLRLRKPLGERRSRTLRGEAGRPVPPGKFLVHVHMSQHENPLGQPLALKAFWPHWFKKNAVKFWSVFMDRFGMPTATVTYQPGAKGQRDEALKVLESYMSTTGVVLPEGVRLELQDAARGGGAGVYETFVEVMDSWMAKLVLGATLTSAEGRHGTQALGGVHADIREDILRWDGRSLAATVGTQLIRWMVHFNFGAEAADDLAPQFYFETDPQVDLGKQVQIDKALARELGLKLPLADLYKKYGVRPPADDEEAIGGAEEKKQQAQAKPREQAPPGAPQQKQAAPPGMEQLAALQGQLEPTNSEESRP